MDSMTIWVALIAVVILALGFVFWKRKNAAVKKPGGKEFGVQLKSGKKGDDNYPIW